jgi:HemY protein
MAPGSVEGALAVARAALDAQEFATARRALTPLAIAPTQRVARLMAELEEKEHGDEGRARVWMTRALHARRDPAWTADGFVSDRWMPVSPVTGRLDAFQWRDPLAGLDAAGAIIEHDKDQRASIDTPAAPRALDAKVPEVPTDALKPSEAMPAEPSAAPMTRSLTRMATVPIAPVIPLVHVPDDPGPESEPQLQPETETAPDASNEAWRKLRGLFK